MVDAPEHAAPPQGAAPELTVRAILTGMVLGALLSTCNIYSGLKIGWGFNMSITAALLSYGFWQTLHKVGVGRSWGLLENNVNQTGASAGAGILGAGLVAPIPALTMLTGRRLDFPTLTAWTLAVSLVGVVVAIGLRRQLLLVDKLPFPHGVATAETVREMYARGREATARLRVLLGAGGIAAGLQFVSAHLVTLPKVALPGSVAVRSASPLHGSGIESYTLRNLGFALDPSLLMVGLGVIVGIRAGISLLLGAVLAWGVIGPWALEQGFAQPGEAGETFWFGPMVEWLLWPGVAMMVTASLTSLAFSWRSVVASLRPRRADAGLAPEPGEVPRSWFLAGLMVALIVATVAQITFFAIAWWAAILAVLLTFLLAVVAGRVSGETGITPVGAMGKITQLTFGVVAPANPAANLMSANVTGGAATQCADMLHDLKTGVLIGASPRAQVTAQVCGVLAGAFAGSAVYLLLVPDPSTMLLTPEWPAPAVATWKAVAEVFMRGFEAMPPGSTGALIAGGAAGVVLAAMERLLPERWAHLVPSPASVGLAFVIPAWNSISMFLGALLAFVATRRWPSWSKRFLLVIAAGVIAGESLAGVVNALLSMMG